MKPECAELVEADPEAFECETCEWRIQREALTRSDEQVLELYGLLSSRAVRFLQLTPVVFDVLQLRKTRRQAVALVRQLIDVHEIWCPPDRGELNLDDDGR